LIREQNPESAMKTALPVLLALAAAGGAAQAQPQRFNSDFSSMQESGPPVVGGNGATAGPNWKNQAILPMPGSTEISEVPRYPITDEPIAAKPVSPPVPQPPRRAPQQHQKIAVPVLLGGLERALALSRR
jgi:hypothetical protein